MNKPIILININNGKKKDLDLKDEGFKLKE